MNLREIICIILNDLHIDGTKKFQETVLYFSSLPPLPFPVQGHTIKLRPVRESLPGSPHLQQLEKKDTKTRGLTMSLFVTLMICNFNCKIYYF